MNNLTLEQVKEYQTKTLEILDQFCQLHNLEYYLAYGTLIGAIRHCGFIPWDDDIDVVMPREAYSYLIEHFNESNYPAELFSCWTNPDYGYPFSKLSYKGTYFREHTNQIMPDMGINIDIFPIDYYPNDWRASKRILKRINFLRRVISVYAMEHRNRGLVKEISLSGIQLLLRISNPNKIAKRIDEIAKQCAKGDTAFLGCIVWGGKTGERLPATLYNEAISMAFEHRNFRVPCGYDIILKEQYGDYMQLPPENQRNPHHDFEASIV